MPCYVVDAVAVAVVVVVFVVVVVLCNVMSFHVVLCSVT